MKRNCPMCAEEIQAKAKLCKHCKSAVTPVAIYSTLSWLLTLALLGLGLYVGIKMDIPAADFLRHPRTPPPASIE